MPGSTFPMGARAFHVVLIITKNCAHIPLKVQRPVNPLRFPVLFAVCNGRGIKGAVI